MLIAVGSKWEHRTMSRCKLRNRSKEEMWRVSEGTFQSWWGNGPIMASLVTGVWRTNGRMQRKKSMTTNVTQREHVVFWWRQMANFVVVNHQLTFFRREKRLIEEVARIYHTTRTKELNDVGARGTITMYAKWPEDRDVDDGFWKTYDSRKKFMHVAQKNWEMSEHAARCTQKDQKMLMTLKIRVKSIYTNKNQNSVQTFPNTTNWSGVDASLGWSKFESYQLIN